MKNQYFGDVGDYGKLALLRFLSNNGIKIAINWYLTANDGTNDGKHTRYIETQYMRRYDSELFDLLADMLSHNQRDVLLFEEKRAIKNAVYYHQLLEQKGPSRKANQILREFWHQSALDICTNAEIVYLDPDNGACLEEPQNKKDRLKYCYANEIADYFNRGQDVVYYCSRGRRSNEQWAETQHIMQKILPEAKIIALRYHKITQTSFVFVLHQEHYQIYSALLKEFVRIWAHVFTEGLGVVHTPAAEKTGEKMCLTDSNGVTVTIEECTDGWINFKFSDGKNVSHRISIDHFIKKLR